MMRLSEKSQQRWIITSRGLRSSLLSGQIWEIDEIALPQMERC